MGGRGEGGADLQKALLCGVWSKKQPKQECFCQGHPCFSDPYPQPSRLKAWEKIPKKRMCCEINEKKNEDMPSCFAKRRPQNKRIDGPLKSQSPEESVKPKRKGVRINGQGVSFLWGGIVCWQKSRVRELFCGRVVCLKNIGSPRQYGGKGAALRKWGVGQSPIRARLIRYPSDVFS